MAPLKKACEESSLLNGTIVPRMGHRNSTQIHQCKAMHFLAAPMVHVSPISVDVARKL